MKYETNVFLVLVLRKRKNKRCIVFGAFFWIVRSVTLSAWTIIITCSICIL